MQKPSKDIVKGDCILSHGKTLVVLATTKEKIECEGEGLRLTLPVGDHSYRCAEVHLKGEKEKEPEPVPEKAGSGTQTSQEQKPESSETSAENPVRNAMLGALKNKP